MATIASKTDNANRLADPENLYIHGFKGIMKKQIKKCRKGLNVCIYYEFNLLHHVGVVAKRVRAAALEGDDNTPSGPNGPRGKNKIETIQQDKG